MIASLSIDRLLAAILLAASPALAVPAAAESSGGADLPVPPETLPTNESEDWRVTSPDRPPVQVRRAVQSVVGSARRVAAGVAGEPVPESPDRSGAMASSESESSSGTTSSTSDAGRAEHTAPAPTAEGERPADAPPSVSETAGQRRSRARSEGWETPIGKWLGRSSEESVDLKPYVDSEKWRRAMELLVKDECGRALTLAEKALAEASISSDHRSVAYAMARIRMCADEGGGGRETLRRLAEGDGAVARLAKFRLGEATPSTGHDGGPSLSDRIAAARRVAEAAGLSKAVGQLSKLASDVERAWSRYRVRMAKAELLLEEGKVAEAGRTLLGIYDETRDWDEVGDRITEKIEKIEQNRDIRILSIDARIDRMRELIAEGEYGKAREVSIRNAEIAGVEGQEIRGWSYYRRGLQAEQQRRRHEAADLFEKAEKLVESPVVRSRLYFGWARALRRIDRDGKAIELYERLCREYPRHHLCDDARFQAGRLHQFHNRHDRARAAFADLVGLHPDSPHVPEALWRWSLSAYLSGDYDAMDRPLDRLRNRYGERTDASGLPLALKARYWQAMAALRRGDRRMAARRFQRTIDRGPLTWYGRLAASRLRQMGRKPAVPLPESDLTQAKLETPRDLRVGSPESFDVVAEYARLQLYDDAISALRRRISTGTAPEGARRLLATLYLADGRPSKAHWTMAKRIESSELTRYNLRDWGLAYPLDYFSHAHRFGDEFGVSPFLVQSVIRQESGFRPEVDSGVGAVGLTQLMPGTANYISDDYLDGEWIGRRQLEQPATNVELGAIYLRALEEFTAGRTPMVLAAYNAGPAPVESWMERFGDRQIDAWVESITYRQARGYVREVYTSAARYRALYGGRLRTIEFELPDRLRDWDEIPQRVRENVQS
ncbi:MAG: transglycosylase SLT domain-containing protein [Bradymonadaceae bacterium]